MKIKAQVQNLKRSAIRLTGRVRRLPRWQQGVALCIISAVIASGFAVYQNRNLYELSKAESALLSASSVDEKLIKQDNGTYTYNRQDETGDTKEKVMTLAANQADTSGKRPYSATLHKDSSDGLEFGDSEGQWSIQLIPKAKKREGRFEQGRMIYPRNSNETHVQTFKRNGIKEDIILSRAPSTDTVTYEWELLLPAELDARLADDGSIRILSADTQLFNNVQVSDEKSQKLIDNARKNGEKTHTVFVLPAPYIKDASGKTNYADASYKLEGKKLTLEARNLKKANYPISIDPTVVVTTTGNFRLGTDDGMIDYDTAGEIRRSNISLGSTAVSTLQDNAFTGARSSHSTVAYNGYLYIIGGTVNASGTDSFTYTGGMQTFVVPTGVTSITVDARGASGTDSGTGNGGNGGRVQTTLSVTPGETLNIYVGGQGGYNGGGTGGGGIGMPGGGGTDIRQGGTALTDRRIIAAGGGGVGVYSTYRGNGGNGGGTTGTGGSAAGSFINCAGGGGGTGAAGGNGGTSGGGTNGNNGSLGQGGNGVVATNSTSGGGGGGYYGGGSGAAVSGACVGGGGGGSSFAGTGTSSTTHTAGFNDGNGSVTITYTGTGGGPQDDIQYCPINPNGSIGTCTRQTGKFSNARYGHTSVVYNGYLYITGGRNGGTFYNDIIKCAINSDGSVGTCASAGSFTTARAAHASVVYNGFLYIVAGDQDLYTHYNDVQYCPIRANGDVGSCTQQFVLNNYRSGAGAAVYNGYLYVSGGFSIDFASSYYYDDVDYCPINSNGSIGTCTNMVGALPDASLYMSSFAYDGYLYLVGGTNSGVNHDSFYCPINADGSLGVCSQNSNTFTNTRSYLGAVVYNGYIYAVGGTTFAGVAQDSIEYLEIDTGTPTGYGSVNNNIQQTNAFLTGRQGQSSVAYNGYLYIIGGSNSSAVSQNDIHHCPINDDGSIGACVQQTGIFTDARYRHSSVAYNGYLYIIGGQTTSAQNDIQYCEINSDGSVDPCVQQLNAFTGTRNSHTSVVYKGYLYIIGGFSLSVSQNDIQYCPFNPNGSVGACVQQTNKFTGIRNAHASVVYNGYLYIIGGVTGFTYYDDISYCPINSDGSVGTCIQQLAKITGGRYGHGAAAYNGHLYIMGGITSTIPESDIQHCPINSNGSIGTCTQQLGVINGGRYAAGWAVYDGFLYSAGGLTATSTYERDIQRFLTNAPSYNGFYERTIDTGALSTSINTLTYQGTANCGVTIKWALAGSGGTFGATTTTLLRPGNSIALNGTSMRYLRFSVKAEDSYCGGTTAITSISVQYTAPSVPNATTLIEPLTSDPPTSVMPVFKMAASDDGEEPQKYRIHLYQSNCSTLIRTIDQTLSQTGWSGQDASGGTAYNSAVDPNDSTVATYTYQFGDLAVNSVYCWTAQSIDPTDTNSWGSLASAVLFDTNSTPQSPTLAQPANNVTGVSNRPRFELRTTDTSGDYVRYKIELCSTSNCSSIISTFDQTLSQTGWSNQNLQSATAYGTNVSTDINDSTLAIYLIQTQLSPNTQYWWRAYAIDPGGTNTWSPASSISTFTTSVNNTVISGGTSIRGGTKISN